MIALAYLNHPTDFRRRGPCSVTSVPSLLASNASLFPNSITRERCSPQSFCPRAHGRGRGRGRVLIALCEQGDCHHAHQQANCCSQQYCVQAQGSS